MVGIMFLDKQLNFLAPQKFRKLLMRKFDMAIAELMQNLGPNESN